MADDLPTYGDVLKAKRENRFQYSEEDLARYGNKDYVIVIDKSTSMRLKMSETDTRTRLKAVEEVAIDLIVEAEQCDDDGLTVYTFSRDFEMKDNVTAEKAIDIFQGMKLTPGTYLHRPLRDIFTKYKARKEAGTSKDGMVVIVIHDGEPTSERKVRNLILDMANNVVGSGEEVGILLVLAGTDPDAVEYVVELDDKLAKPVAEGGYGAKYDIVDYKPIEWLVEHGAKEGFLHSIVD